MNQLQTLNKPSIWQTFLQRCDLARRAFMVPLSNPRIQLGNGIFLDLSSNTVIIDGAFTLHSTGSMHISSDKHLVFMSGRTPEERDGYINSIWFNPELDKQGRPIQESEDDILELVDEACNEKH